MTQDEIRGKIAGLEKAKMSEDVKFWMKTLGELKEHLLIQYSNEKGEEAVRSLGVLKGINMALMLDEIYKSQIQVNLVKPANGLVMAK